MCVCKARIVPKNHDKLYHKYLRIPYLSDKNTSLCLFNAVLCGKSVLSEYKDLPCSRTSLQVWKYSSTEREFGDAQLSRRTSNEGHTSSPEAPPRGRRETRGPLLCRKAERTVTTSRVDIAAILHKIKCNEVDQALQTRPLKS